MLSRRTERILARLNGQDKRYALDAIISLRSSSAMSGASEVAAACRKMEFLVTQGSFGAAMAESKNLVGMVKVLTNGGPALLERARHELGLPAGHRQLELMAG